LNALQILIAMPRKPAVPQLFNVNRNHAMCTLITLTQLALAHYQSVNPILKTLQMANAKLVMFKQLTLQILISSLVHLGTNVLAMKPKLQVLLAQMQAQQHGELSKDIVCLTLTKK
jgi:hypothetical protein